MRSPPLSTQANAGAAHYDRVCIAGVGEYCSEILSDHAEHTLETQHLSHLLCTTDNGFYNALVCKAQGQRFSQHRTFQLATGESSHRELKWMTLQQRGHFSLDPLATLSSPEPRRRDRRPR